MKKSFRKSSPEEIETIYRLHGKGWSAAAIGRYLEKDHTTVLYWLGRIPKQRISKQKYLEYLAQRKKLRGAQKQKQKARKRPLSYYLPDWLLKK